MTPRTPQHMIGYGPMAEEKAEAAVAWILSVVPVARRVNELKRGVAWTVLLAKWHTDTKTPSYYREDEVKRTLLRMEREGFVEKFRPQYAKSNWWRLTDEGLHHYFCGDCGEPKHEGCHGS